MPLPTQPSHALRYVLFCVQCVDLAVSQQIGKVIPVEDHPPMPLKHCTKGNGCTTEATSLTLDAGRRWLHEVSSKMNGLSVCGGLGFWNKTLCPDAQTCAASCALEGVRREYYEKSYGVFTIPDGVQINYVTKKTNVGSRLFLLDADQERYKLFNLKNREFAFDVDVSMLECGMNAALYFVEMPADGGSGMGNNKAGAKYGLGYCDARCPRELNFVNGEANMRGTYGACCTEMDIWEANRISHSMTAHPCSTVGLHRCEGVDCGDGDKHQYYLGLCDQDGCEFNPYRLGNHSLFGPKQMVDTDKKITVVTQFLTEDGTDAGALSEIRRFYIQDGNVIQNSKSIVAGVEGDSISAPLCTAQKQAFVQTRASNNPQGDYNQFDLKGGLGQMSKAFERGMVLTLALWDDPVVRMQWLDSFLPGDLPQGTPGVLRGPCKPEWGNSQWMRENIPDTNVRFANLRFGEIGSTIEHHHTTSEEIHSATASDREPSGGKASTEGQSPRPSGEEDATREEDQMSAGGENHPRVHSQKPAGKKAIAQEEDRKPAAERDASNGHSQREKRANKGHDQQPSVGRASTERHNQQQHSRQENATKVHGTKSSGETDANEGHDRQPSERTGSTDEQGQTLLTEKNSTKSDYHVIWSAVLQSVDGPVESRHYMPIGAVLIFGICAVGIVGAAAVAFRHRHSLEMCPSRRAMQVGLQIGDCTLYRPSRGSVPQYPPLCASEGV